MPDGDLHSTAIPEKADLIPPGGGSSGVVGSRHSTPAVSAVPRTRRSVRAPCTSGPVARTGTAWSSVVRIAVVRVGVARCPLARRGLLVLLQVEQGQQRGRGTGEAEPLGTARLLFAAPVADRGRATATAKPPRVAITARVVRGAILVVPVHLFALLAKDGVEEATGDAAEAKENEETGSRKRADDDAGNSTTTELIIGRPRTTSSGSIRV